MSAGIVAWGTYLPYWRLQRTAIAGVLGSGGGPGHPRRGLLRRGHHDAGRRGRPAGAGRRARAPGRCRTCSSPRRTRPTSTRPAPRRCTPPSGSGAACGAYDFAGSSRSAVGTLLQALAAAGGGRAGPWPWCPTCAPAWPARPRSATAATARRPSCARPTGRWPSWSGRGAASDEFLDRWRVPGEADSHVWEERFGEELYVPAGPRGLRRRAQGRRPGRGRRRPRHRDRAARAGGQGGRPRARRARRGPGARPHRHRSATSAPPTPGVALCDVLERAAARAGHRRAVAGRRRRRPRPAHDRRADRRRRRAAGRGRRADGGRAGGGGPRRPALRDVPDLAGPAAPGAAPPPRSRAPRAHRPCTAPRQWKYAFVGQPLPGLRLPPHAADPGLPVVPRHRPDAARAPGRRAGHRGHLHHRPPGLQPVAARRRASSSTSTAAAATAAR